MSSDPSNEFRERVAAARSEVSEARSTGIKRVLVDALKHLANIERRVPAFREAANRTYAEVVEIYRELDEPLEMAWALRHIGINLEYADELTEAEAYYDESLELFRRHATENSMNYANTVRYPAVVKNRLGKRAESKALWEEAFERYGLMNAPVAVAEAAAWLTIFALDEDDQSAARRWFEHAESAAKAANDPDTDKFVNEVRARFSA